MKNTQKTGALSILILAGILILLPDYIAPVCHGEHIMKCRYLGEANKGVGVAILLAGVLMLLLRNRDMVRGVAAGGVLMSALAIANSVFFIGGCASGNMSCNAVNIPATCLVASMLLLVFLWSTKETKEEKEIKGATENRDVRNNDITGI